MIANCIATDGRTNFLIRTTPNRRVQFRACQATVNEPVDMPRILREPGVVVEVQEGYLDWLPEWIRQIPPGDNAPVKATVLLPQGYSLGPAPNYDVLKDGGPTDKPATSTVGGRRGRKSSEGW